MPSLRGDGGRAEIYRLRDLLWTVKFLSRVAPVLESHTEHLWTAWDLGDGGERWHHVFFILGQALFPAYLVWYFQREVFLSASFARHLVENIITTLHFLQVHFNQVLLSPWFDKLFHRQELFVFLPRARHPAQQLLSILRLTVDIVVIVVFTALDVVLFDRFGAVSLLSVLFC